MALPTNVVGKPPGILGDWQIKALYRPRLQCQPYAERLDTRKELTQLPPVVSRFAKLVIQVA